MSYDWMQEIPVLLDTFAAWNRCFTIREVLEWAADPVDGEQLRHSFRRDARFVHLSQPGWGPECFLPERELFRWWAGFNLRLATIKQGRLTERQLTTAINSLRPEGIWFTPPADILDYGRQFGFVADAGTPGFYAFPIAHILAQASPQLRPAFRSTLADFETPKVRDAALRQRASDAVETLLSQFDQRTYRIIKGRESLPPHQRILKLVELGGQLGCTRERVRQLESRFWKRLNNPTAKVWDKAKDGSSLIPAFIAELMRRQGSLILDPDDPGTAWARFLAKSMGVPCPRAKSADYIIAEKKRSRLNKAEKVYAALQHLVKPSHYSEVTEVYNRLFPDDPTSEHTIHATLSRCREPEFEKYGIVWVGLKGTYALKEHGYERPKLSIFAAVTKVVVDKYAETGKAVHISVITAELGKYRQFVNPTSLAYATGANHNIEQVAKDYYIPKDLEQEAKVEDAASDQDRIIREFWAARGGEF